MPAQAADEWILEVRHIESGSFEIRIAENSIRISALNFGGNTVASGPDWKVTNFQASEKKKWVTPLSGLNGIKSLKGLKKGAQEKAVFTLTTLGKDTVAGMKCSKIEARRFESVRLCWTADDIKTSPKTAEVICRYFNLPVTPHVPLRVRMGSGRSYAELAKRPILKDITNGKKDGKSSLAQTGWTYDFRGGTTRGYKGELSFETKACRKVPYVASDFEIPKGLTAVKEPFEVMLSKSQKTDLSDLIYDIGFATHDKSHESQGTKPK